MRRDEDESFPRAALLDREDSRDRVDVVGRVTMAGQPVPRAMITLLGQDRAGPFGVGVRRATFLIDEDRTIRDAVQADLRIGRHEEFIKNAIALRQSDGAD